MSGPALEDLEIPQIDWGNGGIRLEPCPKRVRVVAAGQMVVDSRRVTMMLEPKHLPVYYFPREHVRMELLIPAKSSIVSALKGPATYWTLRNGDRIVPDAFFSYDDAPSECPDLSGLIGMYWGKMDAVFEEGRGLHPCPGAASSHRGSPFLPAGAGGLGGAHPRRVRPSGDAAGV